MSQDKSMTQQAPNTAENTRARPVVAPPVDIYENAAEYLVIADMPGVGNDAVQIRFEEGELTIRAARENKGEGQILGSELQSVEYQRRFTIPEIVDADKIDAKLAAGVLYLHLPKASRARSRQIAVKAG